ncbi:MAG TPA: sporulation protein YunB [Candidatus Fimimonas gallinarum]|uniref:Sporulation protein YunB n=1 Tax=Candidatus Fimimonas gallinarum TaxID=2840821 RepID=A0A9D1J813_9BACT|nr:sporulation protein YunB [Candidatus Fimimonas gallinarum]
MRYIVVDKAAKLKRRRKIVQKIVAIFTAMVIVALAIALWVYWKSMTPTILDIAQVQVKAQTTQAVNEAVLSVLQGVDYADFVTVEKNSQNEVVLITANSNSVNQLARTASIVTQGKINTLFQQAISIPLGTLSGIPLLSQLGPDVNIVIDPVGTVQCSFVSHFETAGINQTLHRIYLNVSSTVDVIIPSSHQVVQIETPILVCETVIVGKVPDTFLQGGLLLGQSQQQ